MRAITKDDPASAVLEAGPHQSQTGGTLPSVLVQIEYAALNYRDFLAVSGRFRAVPEGHVAGNEGAGRILASTAAGLHPGDRVFVNGHGLGESLAGTLCGRVQVPAEAVTPLPAAMTPRQAAIIGVAGLVSYAAGRILPEGPTAVTGAMGGTGRVAAACFARAGREVTALTRKPETADVLSDLGVAQVLPLPSEAECAADGFGPERFAAAFDVTAHSLNWLSRQMRLGGTMALAGFAARLRPEVNALAFILRQLRLAGVSASLPPAEKAKALQWVAGLLAPQDYDRLAQEIRPAEVAALLGNFAWKPGLGRVLVNLA